MGEGFPTYAPFRPGFQLKADAAQATVCFAQAGTHRTFSLFRPSFLPATRTAHMGASNLQVAYADACMNTHNAYNQHNSVSANTYSHTLVQRVYNEQALPLAATERRHTLATYDSSEGPRPSAVVWWTAVRSHRLNRQHCTRKK